MHRSKPSILLLLSTLLCLAALLAYRPETTLVSASPYPSTNPFDRIIHILRRKLAEKSPDTDGSGINSAAADAHDAGPTTTITVYLPARTDAPNSSNPATNEDDDDGFAGVLGSGSGPRYTQSNGASAFGEGMGDVLASEGHDASPFLVDEPLDGALASASAQPEPRFRFTHQASVQGTAAAHGFEDADHLDYSVVAAAHAHASVSHGTSAASMKSRGSQALAGNEAVEMVGGLSEIEDHAEESLFALAALIDSEWVGEHADSQFSLQDGIIAESLDVSDFL